MPYVFKKGVFLLSLKFFLLSCFFSVRAEAELHVEPYVGLSMVYTNKSPTVNVSNLINSQYWTGPNMGIRLGYSSLGLAVGGDVAVGRWSALGKNTDGTLTPILPGLFVSYKLPLLLKLYAVGIPHSWVSASSNTNKKSCRGRGVKLGFSWISFPFLSVNLEYMPLHFGGEVCNSWSHTASIYTSLTF